MILVYMLYMYEWMTTWLWDCWDKIGQVQEEVARYRRTNTRQSLTGITLLEMSNNADAPKLFFFENFYIKRLILFSSVRIYT